MRILLIKTSSMGDLIHTMPALAEAQRHIPELSVDWVVEEGFATIPNWHPAVNRVLPVAIRRWRKKPLAFTKDPLWQAFRQYLKQQQYDHIIDAQGLFKSAWLGRFAKGKFSGLNRHSAREPLASLFYQNKVDVPFGQHATDRVRQLFAGVLGYSAKDEWLDYGLKAVKGRELSTAQQPYVVFVHGTTWATKHWPESYWRELAEKFTDQGMAVKVPWGSQAEKQRAERICAGLNLAEVLPPGNLTDVKNIISGAQGAVSVDTGLAHLTAALSIPNVSLFGPTNPGLTRPHGYHQEVLFSSLDCAPCLKRKCKRQPKPDNHAWPPCFSAIDPDRVLKVYQKLISQV